jgi:hypothetical protein
MDRQAWSLRQFNRKRARLGADTCQIKSDADGVTNDGWGSFTESQSVLATVNCYYEELTEADSQQVVSGGIVTVKSHRITMEATSITRAIKPSHIIIVLARDDHPAITFEQPTVMESSYSPLVKVAAQARV